MKFRCVGLVVFYSIVLLFCGCLGPAPMPEALEPDVLSPSQIDSSMVDQVVKVRGKILWVTHNPGGRGGLLLKLGDDEGEIGVRIQDDIWETLEEKEKAQFKKGNIIPAEGILFQAGKELVVIYGKFSHPSTTAANNSK